jgi:hypothetical protein
MEKFLEAAPDVVSGTGAGAKDSGTMDASTGGFGASNVKGFGSPCSLPGIGDGPAGSTGGELGATAGACMGATVAAGPKPFASA